MHTDFKLRTATFDNLRKILEQLQQSLVMLGSYWKFFENSGNVDTKIFCI